MESLRIPREMLPSTMLITKKNFDQFLKSFERSPSMCGLDFETTGVWWWKSHHVPWYDPRIFSIQFSTEDLQDFYLDFEHSDDKLGDEHFKILNDEVFANPERYWFDHNAKFELHFARNHGIEIKGDIHCTKHIARVVNNLEETLNLADLSERYLQRPKLDVKTFIEENNLKTKVKRWGRNGKFEDWLHFDKLPLKMLVDYGIVDTQNCRDLGLWQLKRVREINEECFKGASGGQSLTNVLENENKLTKTSFEMERHGVKLDIDYTTKAYEFECDEYERIERELGSFLTDSNVEAAFKAKHPNEPFNWASADHIKIFYETLGEKSYKLTKKGKMSFDKEALETIKHPSAQMILKYRYHYKRAHTYFESYIWLADEKGILHYDIQNSAAETGRQSIWTPSMQNIPKRRDKDEHNFKVRRCFVPRTEEGFFFMDKDYSGAEFYMAMDYARELAIIELIKRGEDPHQWTMEQFNKIGFQMKNRDTAKTMTFRLIYGAGGETIGVAIGHPKGSWAAKTQGKAAKEAYFRLLPSFDRWMKNVQGAARQRGYVFNWLGRVLRYVNTGGFGIETWFKSPNGVIQSGIGDTLKVAMNRIQTLLEERKCKTKMLLPVHDALLFDVHNSEMWLLPLIDDILKNVYPARMLGLEVDAGYSRVSWADLEDEIPAA